MLNRFTTSVDHISLPQQFPSPFQAVPHPLCELAASELKAYVERQAEWHDALHEGKMLGVLVVRDEMGILGYLAAFSGNMAGENLHSYFVPPVADILSPTGFFRQGEQVISNINRQIAELELMDDFAECQARFSRAKQQLIEEVAAAKMSLKASKRAREDCRKLQPSESEQAKMIRESQHGKAELKRLEKRLGAVVDKLQQELDTYLLPIEALKGERKQRSAELQLRLFEEFRFLNISGEAKGLIDIFATTAQKVPPAGAGECAGPKLLQYAFIKGLTPIAMAEFWWGSSPKTEVRHHGYYYPACKGKCEPILGHMLHGLLSSAPFHYQEPVQESFLDVIYEDEWLLIINKPAGMLSAPGKGGTKSAIELIGDRYRNKATPLLAHRLDMATSGLLLIAKEKEAHRLLQAQFENRTVKKRYIALLDGVLVGNEGMVSLPLCLDPLDRPRQMVNYDHGKEAVTRWEVLSRGEGQTRVAFYPLTGRTHQLRVHAAHSLGLGCAIVGDELYGKKSTRLCLHAERLELKHPILNRPLVLEVKADF